jgi:hypothetical protein
MMKHLGFTAREAIAWCRFCRPGSIVGPQQQFLVSIETAMKEQGVKYVQSRDSIIESKTVGKMKALAVNNMSTSSSLPMIESPVTYARIHDKAIVSKGMVPKRKDSVPRRGSFSKTNFTAGDLLKENLTTAIRTTGAVPTVRQGANVSGSASPLRNDGGTVGWDIKLLINCTV